MESQKKEKKSKGKIKEWFRKKIVTLKRNPNYIPLVMLCISCITFNLSLTDYSNTIALINEPGMGICCFIIVLCSFLAIITFLTAFPRRQRVKIGSVILVCFMNVLSIGCQLIFRYFIEYGIAIKENPIKITADRYFVIEAQNMCIIHSILLIISILLIVTIPLYHKLLLKIDTTVEVDENKIDRIDLDEDL